jgi:hypothetical protein
VLVLIGMWWFLSFSCLSCLRVWLCVAESMLLSTFLPFLLLWFGSACPCIVLFAFIFCMQNSLKNLTISSPSSEILSSACSRQSCFGVGFSVLVYWGLFLCLTPFLWGKVIDPSAGSLLSACYAGLLTVFQFCNIIWLWMLLSGSGDELCRLLSALLQAAAYHLTTVSPSAFSVFVSWKIMQRSPPFPSLLLRCA